MHKIIKTLLLLLFPFLGFSQTIYELEYEFNTPAGLEKYKAFMLRNEDGTGLIRLEYFDLGTGGRNLVEMDMVESFGMHDDGKEDTSMLIFVGLDPRLILGKVLYKPDNYVFQWDETSKFYEPSFVLSLNDDDTEDVGTLTNVRFLNSDDLTKEFVLQFFTENDELYANLFETETRGLTAQEKTTQLFLVLVANTDDRSIGNTCEIDRKNTLETFQEISEFLDIKFLPTVIAGKDFSKVNVENAVMNIKPNKNDIVIFYYSGHGFNELEGNRKFPFLDLRNKVSQKYGAPFTMNIEDIFFNIKSKGARLNLVLSDCCNNDPSQSSNISTDIASTRSSSIGWDKKKCMNLFLNQKLSILMTAASKGELSAGNSNFGGIFTFNLRESIEKFIAPFSLDTDWNNLILSAKAQTIKKANKTLCRQADDTHKVCVQNPVFVIQ